MKEKSVKIQVENIPPRVTSLENTALDNSLTKWLNETGHLNFFGPW